MSNLSDKELARHVREHTPMVEALARNLVRKLPANVERDDLVQDGQVALINAILTTSKKITAEHFKKYIGLRVQGAMLDGLRVMDHGSRQLRKDMRAVELAIQRLGHELCRIPLENEVAVALGMPLRKYQRMLQEASDYTLISLDDIMESNGPPLLPVAGLESDPLQVLERVALKESLSKALDALSAQSSEVLRLYYVDDLKMHEVGKHMHVTEARVSQIHAQAIAELRARLVDGSGSIPALKPRRSPRVRQFL